MVYPGVHVIGPTQSASGHYKALTGLIPGFSVGQQATGSMKTVMDGLENLVQTAVEVVGVGLPNSMGTPSLSYLAGETRFIVFAAPLVPIGSGSIHTLLNGGYDTAITNTFTTMLAAGINGPRVSCRVGWEFNSGAGSSGTSGFSWATAHTDPQTGSANGIGNYKLGAAHYETLARAAGYTGFIEWCGGNHDTSALTIDLAMPTHGDPSNTLWGWDVYAANYYNGSKNDPNTSFNTMQLQYTKYLTYCRANGYLMGHGEWGHTYAASSPYTLNDDDVWIPRFYALIAANADAVGYLVFYNQNQRVSNPPYSDTTILSEMHQLFFCGSISGTASTNYATGPYPIGATGLNQTGDLHTQATMGSQQHGSTTSATWLWCTDPNKQKLVASWYGSFGGNGGGSPGLAVTPVAPPVSVTRATRISSPRVLTVVYG